MNHQVRRIGAFIRHEFNVDPYALSVPAFSKLGQEALFLQEFRRQTIEQAIDNRLEEVMVKALGALIK